MTDVHDVIRAIGWVQPTWVDNGRSLGRAGAIADAFRERIDSGDSMRAHDVHALWVLEDALGWAEHDCEPQECAHSWPRYKSEDDCPWCATDIAVCEGEERSAQLWDRERVDVLKRTSWRTSEIAMFAFGSSPADSLQAGIELGYPHFSHMLCGYPVYSKHEKNI